jgi:molybdate transport system substrate-binding protein
MTNPAASVTIRVLCTNGLKTVFETIGPELQNSTGVAFLAEYGSTIKFSERIVAGDIPDVVILTDEAIDKLTAGGQLAGKRIDLAKSFVGVAVKQGAPRPDISSKAAFIQTLRNAKSIARSRLGASGQHFGNLLEQFGLAQELAPKITAYDGMAGQSCADGTNEIAIQQISELMPVAGLDIVGPLPDEIQKVSMFSAGIGANTAQRAAAERFIAYVRSGNCDSVLRDKGLEPA